MLRQLLMKCFLLLDCCCNLESTGKVYRYYFKLKQFLLYRFKGYQEGCDNCFVNLHSEQFGTTQSIRFQSKRSLCSTIIRGGAWNLPIPLVSKVSSSAFKSIPSTHNGSSGWNVCCGLGRGRCRKPSQPAVHNGVLSGSPEFQLLSKHHSNSESNSLSSLSSLKHPVPEDRNSVWFYQSLINQGLGIGRDSFWK